MVKRVSVQLPGDLAVRLEAAAGVQRRSVSAEVVWRLEQFEEQARVQGASVNASFDPRSGFAVPVRDLAGPARPDPRKP